MPLIQLKEISRKSHTYKSEFCGDLTTATVLSRLKQIQPQRDCFPQPPLKLMRWGIMLSLVTTGLTSPPIAASQTTLLMPRTYGSDRPAIDEPTQLAQTIPLNLEGRYPNDIAVRVRGIRFVENSIVLNLEIINGSDIAIQLNSGEPQQGMVLQDDVGNRYSLVTPESNSSIGLLAGERLAEEFTFAGPVSSSATSLTLITNDRAGQTDMVPTIVPKIVISGIPIQQR
jgi:hypothetical protein